MIRTIKILVMALALSMSACVFDSDSSPTASSSSTSSSSIKKARLSINDPSLKRVVIDAPSNVITKREVKNDLTFGEYEEVSIAWGSVEKKNYDFTYYLYSTTGAVKIDSVTFNDSLTFVSKYVIGNLITDKVGLTGDGMLPITYIGDSLLVNKINYKRFHHKDFDSTIVMVVYGTDTLTKLPTKLQVNFLVKQKVKSVVTNGNSMTLYNSATDTILYRETYVDSLENTWSGFGLKTADRDVQYIYSGETTLSWDVMSFVQNPPDSLKPKVGQIYWLTTIKSEFLFTIVPVSDERNSSGNLDYSKGTKLAVFDTTNTWYIK